MFFWRKFSRYLLVGLSAVLLLIMAQSSYFEGFTQKGPKSVLAEGENCDVNGYGCPEPGPVGDEVPTPPEAPAPQAPSASTAPVPQCNPVFKYNECIACNTSRPVYTNSCSGAFSTGPNQDDAQCASWCQQQPAPPTQGGSSCTPNDQIDTKQDCSGDQWCTFNKWRGSDCSTGFGGPYNCQNIAGQCGYNPAPAQVCTPNQFDANSCSRCSADGTWKGNSGSDFGPNNGSTQWCSCAQRYNQSAYNQYCQVPAPTNYPTAPSCPTDRKQCLDGTSVSRNPGDGCNFYACPSAPVCNSTTTRENAYCSAQRYCADDVTRDCNNNVTARNQNCQYISGQCGYNPGNSCTPSNTTVSRCVGQSLCSVDLTTNSNCSHTESGTYNCQNSASCGYNPPQACTPSNTSENRCVGQQSCTFNNIRSSDCSTSTTGPFSCQSIIGQCGYNPGTVCTPSTTQQASCVGQQMCQFNITRNSDCTMTTSGATNCQNSASCGYRTTTVVQQTFGNVGVGTSVSAPTYYYAGVKQLPNTGLPAIAWAAAAFIPAGFRLRKLGSVKKDLENNPNYLWENRQYHRS